MKSIFFIIFISSLMFNVLNASQKAHMHSEAKLEVAFSGDYISIGFHSPLMDIVNFEHKPKTNKEKNILKEKLFTLKKINFYLDKNANCSLASIEIEDIFKDGDHDEEHHDEDKEEHFEIAAEYVYKCKKPNLLNTLNTRDIFKHFPSISKINSELITDKKQHSDTLNKKSTTLKLK